MTSTPMGIIIYDLTGQCYNTYMYMLEVIYWWGNTNLISLHPPSFIKGTLLSKALTLSTANMHRIFEHLRINTYVSNGGWQHGTQQDMTEIIMALAFNNNHIIYYNMDAK